MLNSFIFSFACCPTPFSLPTDPYLVYFCFFGPLWRWWSKISKSCKTFMYFFFVRINGRYLFPWKIKTGHCLPVIVPFLLSNLATPMHNLPSCSYLKVEYFGWLFVSYLPVLTSMFPSSSLGNQMFCSFILLVTGGPLTSWMWNSSKKMSWVGVRYRSCYLSYQYGSWLISAPSLL